MKFLKLTTKEQFKNLEKGNVILVKWDNYFVKHHPKSKKIMMYHIVENRERCEEIICQIKGNHYFNYDRYLQGLSSAEEVYLILP